MNFSAEFVMLVKIVILVIVLLMYVTFRASELSLDALTPIGTFLTGLAAFFAAGIGYFATLRQVRNSNTTAWIQQFRNAAAEYLVIADKISPSSSLGESKEYMRAVSTLRLFLSAKRPAQAALIEHLEVFTAFLMQSKVSRYQFDDMISTYYRRSIDLIEKVIYEAEAKL